MSTTPVRNESQRKKKGFVVLTLIQVLQASGNKGRVGMVSANRLVLPVQEDEKPDGKTDCNGTSRHVSPVTE